MTSPVERIFARPDKAGSFMYFAVIFGNAFMLYGVKRYDDITSAVLQKAIDRALFHQQLGLTIGAKYPFHIARWNGGGKSCGIYSFVNQKTQRRYVGQSVDIIDRWDAHRRKMEGPYRKEMTHDGQDNFTFEVLEFCSCQELDDREEYWICHFNCRNPESGYNIR